MGRVHLMSSSKPPLIGHCSPGKDQQSLRPSLPAYLSYQMVIFNWCPFTLFRYPQPPIVTVTNEITLSSLVENSSHFDGYDVWQTSSFVGWYWRHTLHASEWLGQRKIMNLIIPVTSLTHWCRRAKVLMVALFVGNHYLRHDVMEWR